MTIFRIVEFLEAFGHQQTIWIQDAVQFVDQSEALTKIRQWYRPVGSRVHIRFLPEDVRQLSGDILIATDVWTTYPAALTTNFKERFYFVQDDEASFHPAGELHLLARASYGFGFAVLCAGDWLLGLMHKRGCWAESWDLCADDQFYYPNNFPQRNHEVKRIAFYARPYTPRRATNLGYAAFEILQQRGIPIRVELFGENDLQFDYQFPNTKHGILSASELGDLYRRCDIGVVFSATNYSLVPLEMMACGLPVVELDVESTRAIFQHEEVKFAQPNPYAIADAIESLLNNHEEQQLQSKRGHSFLASRSWRQSAQSIEKAILKRLSELNYSPLNKPDFSSHSSGNSLKSPAVSPSRKLVTIAIPTLDAGPSFKSTIDSILDQKCGFDYNVIVLDSESTDETLDICRLYRDKPVRVETVKRENFQHGRTRNLAFELTNSEYVAYLTQDALPCDDKWLNNLIVGFTKGNRVAGVIGRHRAYPHHSKFTARDIDETFDNLALLPNPIDIETGLPSYIYPGGQSWRMLMHFYSDNNSAMARAAWEIFPYPEIDWGEDQVWADEILRLGFQKSYADDAVVFHSHDFSVDKLWQVSSIEGRFWGQFFGVNLHNDPEASLEAMDLRDAAYAKEYGIDRATLSQRKLRNRAVVEGRCAGYESLPPM